MKEGKMQKGILKLLLVTFSILGFSCARKAALVSYSGWSSWRGPYQNGVSDDTGLVSNWSLDGENLVWKADFISGGSRKPIYWAWCSTIAEL